MDTKPKVRKREVTKPKLSLDHEDEAEIEGLTIWNHEAPFLNHKKRPSVDAPPAYMS